MVHRTPHGCEQRCKVAFGYNVASREMVVAL